MNFPHLQREVSQRKVWVFAIAGTVWLLLFALAALLLWNDRRGEIEQAKLRGAATTALLQAHTDTTFRAVEYALAEIARALERDTLPRHDEGLRLEMRKRLPSMPYVRALFVIGPDGYIQHDTDFPKTPDVSLTDRPYFQQYLRADTSVTSISAPILSRTPGLGWFVAVTHRIGKKGDFRGVAVAAIQLAYFSDLYKVVGVDDQSEILLFHRDGRLMAQYPGTSGKIGDSYAAFPLFQKHLATATSGAYLTDSAPLPYLRLVNYVALTDIPLVVVKTENMDARLARWQARAVGTVAAMFLFFAFMMYVATHYLRAWRARQLQHERNLQSEKMEALGQLTGGIAHDFGNILGVIAMNIGLVRKMTPDGRVAAALDRAGRALESGTTLTKQLMSFSRKRDLDRLDCDLNVEISSVLGLLEHAAGPDCKVVFEPAQLAGTARLDRAELGVALINLVVNARHAIERDGRIAIRTYSAAGKDLGVASSLHQRRFICVCVEDNGKGMPDDIRRRAVEPFFTTKGEEGTGFGLAQVYSMMQQLGGDLTIQSRVGVGTSVTLCFPAEPLPFEQPPRRVAN
jgi:signal transduction histidine kinase